MILRFPDDVQHWFSVIEFEFKTHGKNQKPISYKDALKIHKKIDEGNLITGRIPGDGFIKNKSGIYAFVEINWKDFGDDFFKQALNSAGLGINDFIGKTTFEDKCMDLISEIPPTENQKPVNIYERILYIGKAKNLRNRLHKHFKYNSEDVFDKIMDDEKDFEVYVWYLDDFESLEKKLIQTLKPKYNTVFNRGK